MTTRQKYRQAIKTETRHGRTVNVPEGFRYKTSYPVGHDGLKKSKDYYEKKGLKTLVTREGKRELLFVEDTRKVKPKALEKAKVKPKKEIVKPPIKPRTDKEPIFAVKDHVVWNEDEYQVVEYDYSIMDGKFRGYHLKRIKPKGDPKDEMWIPKKFEDQLHRSKPKAKAKPKRVKKPKKHKIKPSKPRMKMTHIEKMHLLASAKEFNIDPQEIDNTLTYYENKKHIHEMARAKGVSEMEISASEKESKEWASQYQEYLGNLKGELEGAGYTVTSP